MAPLARNNAWSNTLDAYMDCPHRERNAMYGVEGYWMQKAVYPLFGDTSVSRRSILYGADSVTDPEGTAGPADLVHIAYPMHLKFFNTVIPTQPLFWVLHAGLYERCSGDTELIRTVLPVIRRNLAAMDGWRNSDGLLESIPGWMFLPRPCFCSWSRARPAPCGKTSWPASPCATASPAGWAGS